MYIYIHSYTISVCCTSMFNRQSNHKKLKIKTKIPVRMTNFTGFIALLRIVDCEGMIPLTNTCIPKKKLKKTTFIAFPHVNIPSLFHREGKLQIILVADHFQRKSHYI